MEFHSGTYLIEGGQADISSLLTVLEGERFRTKGNPDLYVRSYGSFGVDDARDLSQRASSRALSEQGRVFIIAADAMTAEAQNALLKTLEEPSLGARFFLIVPTPAMLLPTLRSRAQTLALKRTSKTASVVSASAFLAAPAQERLDMLKPLLEKGDDDRRDLSETIRFLGALEGALASDVDNEMTREGIRAVYRARCFIGDRGALWKPLLEQIALLAPRV